MPRDFRVASRQMAEIVAALMWGPKKSTELMEIVGCDDSQISIRLNALHDSGVVYRLAPIRMQNKPGRPERAWALQSKPFAMEDEP